jgi:hypothetical protein
MDEEMIWNEVLQLPPRLRIVMVLVLKDMELDKTFNVSDIARALGLSQSATYERLEKGMIALGERLQKRVNVQQWLKVVPPDPSHGDNRPVARLGEIIRREVEDARAARSRPPVHPTPNDDAE